MSLDTLKTLESLRGCEFTPQQAEVMTGILIEREEDLVTKEDLARELQDVRREIGDLRKDMEHGFALMERRFAEMDRRFVEMDRRFVEMQESTDQRFVAMDRRFVEMQEAVEREFALLREETQRNLEHAMAEQRRHTDRVAEAAALRDEQSRREMLMAMILVAGVMIAAVGLMVAFL